MTSHRRQLGVVDTILAAIRGCAIFGVVAIVLACLVGALLFLLGIHWGR